MSSPPPPEKYFPGLLVGGKYRLDRLIGEGGMGSVWAAHNVALDSAVAIKLIRGDQNREDMGLRLLQEARAAARLGHPAIVRVFDVGQAEQGDPFIVMEHLEGESLGSRLFRESRLTANEAVKLLLPIADALRAAHAKGIVHRDIKPDNVFLAVDGTISQPKLVDFGIAKLEQLELVTHQTERGVLVGSPDYMSPEQARGEENIDFRTDIWSFCVVLYQALSGAAPFSGPNYHALLRAIVEDDPVSLTQRAAGDKELSALIEVGLAKDREARWRSMDELGVALAGWLARQGVFEDAAGGSLDARWLNRLSEPGRPARGSFPSLPGEIVSPSGMARTPVQFGAGAHAPTSLAPASVRTSRRRSLPWTGLALGLAVLGIAAFFWLRPAREPPHFPAHAEQRAPAPALPAEPRALPSTVVELLAAPAVKSPSPRPSSVSRPRERGKKPLPSASPETRPGLDSMAPY